MLLISLLILGSSIFLLLGTLHLLYTFFTTKFDPHNKEAQKAMETTNPRLTKETSVWKAWIGFNASHSTGAMFFGIVTIYLAIFQPSVVTDSLFYISLCTANAAFYLFLARNYWFSIPVIGISISTLCFVGALLLVLLG